MSAQHQAMIEDGDPAAILAGADGRCELCGEHIPQEDVSVEAFEASGLLICLPCLERTLEDAPTLNARSEVGMVGAGRCW